MANETIGHIDCPHCKARADVRRYKSGSRALYYVCGCGIIRPNTRQGQDWILNHARLFGPNGAPDEGGNIEVPPVEVVPSITPSDANAIGEQKAKVSQKVTGFFADINI